MNEELAAGLRNAIERGASLEEAMASFITAGYNAREVQEAGASLTQGATSTLNPSAGPTPPLQKTHVPAMKPARNPSPLPSNNPVQKTQVSTGAAGVSAPSVLKTGALASVKPLAALQKPVAPLATPPRPVVTPLTSVPLPKLSDSLPQENKKSHGKIIALIILMLVLLGIVIIGLVFTEEIVAFFK